MVPPFQKRHPSPTYVTILILEIEIFVFIYGDKKRNTLPYLQYTIYMKMAAKTSNIDHAILPPSDTTAQFHSLIVFLQVCEWKAFCSSGLNPLYWGWNLEHRRMTPVMSDEV